MRSSNETPSASAIKIRSPTPGARPGNGLHSRKCGTPASSSSGSLGVAGWVTNRPDGAVEAVFEGEPEAVAAIVEWCRHGPRGAHVESVDDSSEEPEGLSRFEIC